MKTLNLMLLWMFNDILMVMYVVLGTSTFTQTDRMISILVTPGYIYCNKTWMLQKSLHSCYRRLKISIFQKIKNGYKEVCHFNFGIK